MPYSGLKATIESAWERRETLNRKDHAVRESVEKTIDALDAGGVRVAEPTATGWVVNQWLKKAVLLYFRLHDSSVIELGRLHGYDKVPLKYSTYDAVRFAGQGVRVVPPATVRRGAYVAPGAVLMPSFVNIGAYVGANTMVDTWASIGSCAQVGANVHVSAGAGIGGVLEPLQANPTIIEDDCFIGARSEIVEGVIVGKGSVISMGVFITQSTPIYDRETGETLFGRIPPGSVVVAGSMPREGGKYSLSCAVIVKKVDEKTRAKVGINELLRDV
jgi:2,3,4,5-tetrahydropyridine-2,6-dicarboxylate N-succinyltransferase